MLWLLAVLGGVPAASASMTLGDDRCGRTVAIVEGRLHTASVRGPCGTVALRPGPEFALTFLSGRRITAADYRAEPAWSSPTSLGVRLWPRRSGDPSVLVHYWVAADGPCLHKTVEVVGDEVVDAVAVECLPWPAAATHGGFGQPVFLGQEWFAGLEHPAGFHAAEGPLALVHHPGRSRFRSKTAVLGTKERPRYRLRDEFERYVMRLAPPPRQSLQYNGWYDRRGAEVNPQRLAETYRRFREKLLKPYGLAFDAFCIDDGYQNPRSLWDYAHGWPEGLRPLRALAAADGSRLGLWLPLNGYGLDTAWGAERGWELSDHRKGYYSLAGAEYRRAIKAAVRRRIEDGDLAYLKHDFNFLHSGAAGHGHPPTARHGLEASVDGQLEVLRHERSVQPGIFLNVTSAIWHSPWWLGAADTLWLGGPDLDEDWSLPATCPRDAENTARDAWLHRRLVQERGTVPASRLMTHGIIAGRHDGRARPDTVRAWSDHVVWHLARGTLLHELYLSPELVPDTHWPILAAALRWARANRDAFAHTRMVGGRPEAGVPYGFAHWAADRGVTAVRNPGATAATIRISDDRRPLHLPAADGWHPVVVYPYRERLPAGRSATLRLHAHGVAVVEWRRDLPADLAALPVGRFAVAADGRHLVSLAAAAVQVQPTGRPASGKKLFRAGFAVTAPADAAVRVVALARPASGVAVTLAGADGRDATADPHGRRWSLRTWDVPADGRLALQVGLPPTPLYPETAAAAVELRAAVPLRDVRTVSLTEPLAWPMAPDERVLRESVPLLPRRRFERSRSLPERAAWLVLLGLLPTALCCVLARRLAGAGVSVRSVATHGAVACGWGLLYAATPLGASLARCLP